MAEIKFKCIEKKTPLSRYKYNLRAYLEKQLVANRIIAANKFNSFFSKIFVKWIFNELKEGTLDENLVPTRDIFKSRGTLADIHYLFESEGVSKDIYGDMKFTFEVLREKPTIIAEVRVIYEEGSGNKVIRQLVSSSHKSPLIVSTTQYKFLVNKHKGGDFVCDLYNLLSIYLTLGGFGNFLSIPIGWPAVEGYEKMELFGSPFNTQYSYCSPFPFEVEKWSSCGSFFDFMKGVGKKVGKAAAKKSTAVSVKKKTTANTDKEEKKEKPAKKSAKEEEKSGECGGLNNKTIYLANPPFDVTIMSEMADLINAAVGKQKDLVFFIVIPAWDKETRKAEFGEDNAPDYSAFDKLDSSKHKAAKIFMPKDEYLFYSWGQDRYVAASSSWFFILSGDSSWDEKKAAECLDNWKSLAI